MKHATSLLASCLFAMPSVFAEPLFQDTFDAGTPGQADGLETALEDRQSGSLSGMPAPWHSWIAGSAGSGEVILHDGALEMRIHEGISAPARVCASLDLPIDAGRDGWELRVPVSLQIPTLDGSLPVELKDQLHDARIVLAPSLEASQSAEQSLWSIAVRLLPVRLPGWSEWRLRSAVVVGGQSVEAPVLDTAMTMPSGELFTGETVIVIRVDKEAGEIVVRFGDDGPSVQEPLPEALLATPLFLTLSSTIVPSPQIPGAIRVRVSEVRLEPLSN